MKESEDWSNGKEYPLPPKPDEGSRAQEPWPGYEAIPQGYPSKPLYRGGKRSKWIAGILAFLIPGIGHMYLGLMVKGIVLMLLVALDITAIVYVSVEGSNVLSVVLLSLLLPIIYFYNLFDAIQSTDAVNERNASFSDKEPAGWTDPTGVAKPTVENGIAHGMPPGGILIFAAAGVVILIMAGSNWTHWLFDSVGSMIGAIVLIGAGVGLWFWEMRGQHRGKR